MNKPLFFSLLTIFFLGLTGNLSFAQQDQPYVHFQENEAWKTARSLAAEENKYLMVDAYTDWCGWCKVQDKETFHHPEVAAYMNKNFVSVKIDFERGIGIDLAMKYRVRAYPTLLFFTPEGELAGRIIGYESEIDKFLAQVEAMRDPSNHPAQIGDPQVLDTGFPDFYREAFGKSRKYPEAEVVVEWLKQQDDIFSEPFWNVLSMMPLTEEYQSQFLKNLPAYQERFGKEEAGNVVDNIVNARYRDAITQKDVALLENALNLKKEFSHDPLNESYMRINFYQRTGDWQKAATELESVLANTEPDKTHGMVNSIAWGIYESCDDPAVIQQAAGWMEKVTQQEPEYMYLDTYAALLFKSGDLKAAQQHAQIAITAGKSKGETVTETEELLKKIEAGLQGKK